MALTAASRPILNGLRPAPGSLRLIALRVAVLLLSSAPALIAAFAGVAGGAARRPYYTEVEGRLPIAHLVRVFQDLPTSFVPAVVASVVLAVLADQLLTGGALALLDPARPRGERIRVIATVWRDGLTHLWPFLRAALLGLVLSAAGIALLRLLFKRLDVAGYRSGWTGQTVMLTLPMLSLSLSLLWLAVVGAWVFWCRLITAADGRRRVRRTGLLALRVLRRHPLRALGLFVALTLASTILSGAVLVAWRQADPGSAGRAIPWFLGWLCMVLAQAFVWHWLLRAGRLLYAGGDLADLRGVPDDPLRLLAKLAFWRWRFRRARPRA
jgi:hypothetical protein